MPRRTSITDDSRGRGVLPPAPPAAVETWFLRPSCGLLYPVDTGYFVKPNYLRRFSRRVLQLDHHLPVLEFGRKFKRFNCLRKCCQFLFCFEFRVFNVDVFLVFEAKSADLA
jgi:hypothetical protein